MFNLNIEEKNLKSKENLLKIEGALNKIRQCKKMIDDSTTWKNKNIELALSSIDNGLDSIYKVIGEIFDNY